MWRRHHMEKCNAKQQYTNHAKQCTTFFDCICCCLYCPSVCVLVEDYLSCNPSGVWGKTEGFPPFTGSTPKHIHVHWILSAPFVVHDTSLCSGVSFSSSSILIKPIAWYLFSSSCSPHPHFRTTSRPFVVRNGPLDSNFEGAIRERGHRKAASETHESSNLRLTTSAADLLGTDDSKLRFFET